MSKTIEELDYERHDSERVHKTARIGIVVGAITTILAAYSLSTCECPGAARLTALQDQAVQAGCAQWEPDPRGGSHFVWIVQPPGLEKEKQP